MDDLEESDEGSVSDILEEVSENDEESEYESLPDEMRNDFNIESTKEHSYIFNEDTVEVLNIDTLPENESHILPYIKINSVIVPGETLPLSPRCPYSIENLKRLVQSNEFVILLFDIREREYDPHNNTRELDLPCFGTVAKITKHSEMSTMGDQYGRRLVSVELSAIHRCKVFSIDRNIRKCGVTVLPDILLPSVMSLTLSREALAMNSEKRARLCTSLINYPKFAVYNLTDNNCETLIKYLSVWFSEASLRNILAMGKVPFSFWVTANFTMELSKKYDLLSEDSTDLRLFKLAKYVQKVNRSICRNCGTSIFKTADIIKMSSEGLGGHYVNPGGTVHNLVTVSTIQEFNYQGLPSSEYCWFPGYRWQIIVCSRCYAHLGWEYTSDTLRPRKFYGITRTSIEQVTDMTVDEENEAQL